MVVCAGESIRRLLPVPIGSPPHEPANQRSVSPEPPEAVSVTAPASEAQKSERSAPALVGACGPGAIETATEAHAEKPQVFSQRTK